MISTTPGPLAKARFVPAVFWRFAETGKLLLATVPAVHCSVARVSADVSATIHCGEVGALGVTPNVEATPTPTVAHPPRIPFVLPVVVGNRTGGGKAGNEVDDAAGNLRDGAEVSEWRRRPLPLLTRMTLGSTLNVVPLNVWELFWPALPCRISWAITGVSQAGVGAAHGQRRIAVDDVADRHRGLREVESNGAVLDIRRAGVSIRPAERQTTEAELGESARPRRYC